MTSEVDEYIANTIRAGDEGSKFLAARCAPTLKNSKYVNIVKSGMNGIAVIDNIPSDKVVVVHSMGGSPDIRDSQYYACSLVDRLCAYAEEVGARPIAMADIVDANGINTEVLDKIAAGLVMAANDNRIAIINGELADLGKRVNCEANLSGTMISLLDRNRWFNNKDTFGNRNITYAVFDPRGEAVFMNSDGIGTKTEFYERSKEYERGVEDFIAMNVDDAIKLGADLKVISGVLEYRGKIPLERIDHHMKKISKSVLKAIGILQPEHLGDRIAGYASGKPTYNISGSAVSTINLNLLSSPPKPSEGEMLIAIRGVPNPRSNGITAKRKAMIAEFGDDWHTTLVGRNFLEYLATPSTILYPVFRELHNSGVGTSFYHLSGGAFNGKLARPLAKHGLFVELNNLFSPDPRETTLANRSSLTVRDSYEKWPMGTDGFVTTNNEVDAINLIKRHGLEGRVVGKLQRDSEGKTGVELKAYNGEKVYFDGK